ncbi:SRPBCC family protein [Niallia circulans]|uniref:SRPBCC family protein n=1 Tax=Niallia circulans TaxID=1397 RepID=A0A553SNQ9_NIACI|nr:SRPBCC family protein [Niallia circulans]TRZ38635.1 SRPBCC family protein [Niallia circulans]
MLADIKKVEEGYTAIFKRNFRYNAEQVWSALTDNEKLTAWFHNLEAEDLRIGGNIRFYMRDGTNTSIEMKILDFKEGVLLEYEWGEGSVRFEVAPSKAGSSLVLCEIFPNWTDHTPKDIAGWHASLEVLSSLLDGKVIEFPMERWEDLFKNYQQIKP